MQEAFWNEHDLQYGFCTPGMIMASKQILDRNPKPTEEEIRHGLEGNVCRCTGYQHIVNAVKAAAAGAAKSEVTMASTMTQTETLAGQHAGRWGDPRLIPG